MPKVRVIIQVGLHVPRVSALNLVSGQQPLCFDPDLVHYQYLIIVQEKMIIVQEKKSTALAR